MSEQTVISTKSYKGLGKTFNGKMAPFSCMYSKARLAAIFQLKISLNQVQLLASITVRSETLTSCSDRWRYIEEKERSAMRNLISL